MQGNLDSGTVTVSEVTNVESDSNGDYDQDVLHSEMATSTGSNRTPLEIRPNIYSLTEDKKENLTTL